MIEGSTWMYTGTLGGGKTLGAADEGLEHLSKGGTWITNIEVYREEVRKWMLEEFGLIMQDKRLVLLNQASIADFQNMAMRGNEKNTVLMTLDEAALDVGARDWAKHSEEQFNFVILCRKLIIDLRLVAQDANDVDKRIRGKMQREIHCRSLMKLFDFADGLLKIPLFFRVTYTIEQGKKPHRKGFKSYWKGISWGKFNSHALHGAKAQLFAALESSDSSALKHVEYDVKPYVIVFAVAMLSAIIATCLFAS